MSIDTTPGPIPDPELIPQDTAPSGQEESLAAMEPETTPEPVAANAAPPRAAPRKVIRKNPTAAPVGMMIRADVRPPSDDALFVPASAPIAEESEDELLAFLGADRFPVEILPANIKRIVEVVAANKCAHPEMVFMHLLPLVNACMGAGASICPHRELHSTWHEMPTIWAMIVGKSGQAKSPTMKLIFRSLMLIQRQEELIYDEKYKKYLGGYAAWAKIEDKDAAGPPPNEPVKTQFCVDDATIESLHAVLQDNNNILWRKDEIRSLLKNLNKYNAGDSIDVLLSLWSPFDWINNRTSRKGQGPQASKTVYDACCGIYGGIQPGVLERFFSADDIFAGLAQRFLFCFVRGKTRKTLRTPAIPRDVLDEIDTITRRLVSYRQAEIQLFLTEEAFDLFDDFYGKLLEYEPESFLMKATNNTLRLALIMHFLTSETPYSDVTAEEMRIAIRLIKWFLSTLVRHVLPLFSIMKSKSDEMSKTNELRIHFIEKFIMENQGFCEKEHTATDILQIFKKGHPFMNIKGEASPKILGDTLTAMGFEQNRTGKGRYYNLLRRTPQKPVKLQGFIDPKGRIRFADDENDSDSVTVNKNECHNESVAG